MTSSNENIFRVTGRLCRVFTGHRWFPSQRPATRSFDVFFDLRLNKHLSKQSWGWWFETPSRSLWRHRNESSISCFGSSFINAFFRFSSVKVLLFDPKHDDVIKWKHFPRYWPFVRRTHRSPVNSPHKGQWRGALKFSFICTWINSWIDNLEAGDLRRHRARCLTSL